MTQFGFMAETLVVCAGPMEMATLAEQAGFESLFVGEHSHLPAGDHRFTETGIAMGYEGFADPFVYLTAAASVTNHIRLGTAVTLVTEHHPITQAKTIATPEQISNGRLVLGVGPGWNPAEVANYGVEFKDRWRYGHCLGNFSISSYTRGIVIRGSGNVWPFQKET